ncbi:IS66 family transposase [Cloacibacillus evryensis]|uniref:IS66 family transposase n=1 Tax=Cloacibacillus evryensis TaxID=508460 RepID=UPI003CCB8FC6
MRNAFKKAKPITDAFFAWAASARALPQSTLGKALHYALEQRIFLETFYMDGRIEISNNRAERSIKPFVIGRKTGSSAAPRKGQKAAR